MSRIRCLIVVAVLAAAPAAAAPAAAAPAAAAEDGARLRREAARVVITRDDRGIAHVHGRTDADAVFGMAYAQAEDDFNRIETNYLVALGRLAEAQGSAALAQDLRARLFVDPADLRARYARSPGWLKALLDGWADGLNDYLLVHPEVRPRVITRFEPWMALGFSEGSIGGDGERSPLPELARFYRLPAPADPSGQPPVPPAARAPTGSPTGSNGIAIAPANTASHHALLLINPHTSFYFRSELQMSSDAGLDAYGAVTWGQFFVYQGFNDRLGWMHTSSHSDAVDSFLETVVRKDGRLFTRTGDALRSVSSSVVTLSCRTGAGTLASVRVPVYRTDHGPVVGTAADGRWIAEAMMFKPVEALQQSYALTRARDYRAFMRVMQLKANTSNNTVYADADGHIAYLHPQFIPRRDDRFDYTRPVDGADPRTAWNGLHALDDAPHLLDPATGWIQNTNNWPYSAAGSASPKQADFPRYMDTDGENVRGLHAVALLRDAHDVTLEGLLALAFDPGEPGFDILLPHLFDAFDHLPQAGPLRTRLSGPVATLRAWDRRWSVDSVPTSLAVYWGEALWREAGQPLHGSSLSDYDAVLARTTAAQRLDALAAAIDRLDRDFGTWRTPWGRINRFQRLTDALVPRFSDDAPSLPVGFTSAQWGSLASIDGPARPGVRRRYGDNGNSFVAVVEFGPRVRALAVTAGGESGDPRSPHFDDQALRYSTGALRPVYFYPDQLLGHTIRRYHPGE